MPSPTTFALFSLAALALAVVPGPAVTYIVTQSFDKGRRAGLVSALGVANGGLVHVAAATAGLSALVASSAAAFTVVKLAGAAYLVLVGLQRMLERGHREVAAAPEPSPTHRLYVQGLVVDTLNPKVALFFVSFLPQFVAHGHGPVALQIGLLGCLYVLIALVSDSLYVLAAGLAGRRLRRSRVPARTRRLLSGGVFVALGLTAATAHRPA